MKLPRTKEWRESQGLTQRGLADEAGITYTTVARIEMGHEAIPTTARKIAKALGITVADLMERPPVPLGALRTFNLAAMSQEPDEDNRLRALEAASPEELSRYLRDIDRMLVATNRQLRSPEHQEPGEQAGLAKHLQEMLDLREEAEAFTANRAEQAQASVK